MSKISYLCQMLFEGKTVSFYTLGCKLNFSETSSIARTMQENGFRKVNFEDGADVCVINTCSVTESADKECKQIVKTALSKNPETFIAVIGCYAQLKPDEISNIDGVDVVLGASEKFKLLNYIHLSGKNTHAEIHNCDIADVNTFIGSFSVGDRTRSFLKVQDGCDLDKEEVAEMISEGTQSQVVQIIGNNILLYKCHREKPIITLPD